MRGKNAQRDYALAFKLAVVDEVEKGDVKRRSDPVSKPTRPQTPEQRIKELETQLKDANQQALFDE